ncbi:MAG TPA: hypothetical protein VF188_09790 [Longimicrobiales bacterium]
MIRSFLFGVSPLDPATFLGVPRVLAAAAPARTTARIDPVRALKV